MKKLLSLLICGALTLSLAACSGSVSQEDYKKLASDYGVALTQNDDLKNKIDELQNKIDELESEVNSYGNYKSVFFDETISLTLLVTNNNTGISICNFDGTNEERECALIMGCTAYFFDKYQLLDIVVLDVAGKVLATVSNGDVQLMSKYLKFDLENGDLYKKYSTDIQKILS